MDERARGPGPDRSIYLCRSRGTLADDASGIHIARRVVAAIENVGVQVDLPRPFDGLGLGVDAHLLKRGAVVTDRGEDPACAEEGMQVDVLHGAVGERQP